jgi:hypothetical protein
VRDPRPEYVDVHEVDGEGSPLPALLNGETLH